MPTPRFSLQVSSGSSDGFTTSIFATRLGFGCADVRSAGRPMASSESDVRADLEAGHWKGSFGGTGYRIQSTRFASRASLLQVVYSRRKRKRRQRPRKSLRGHCTWKGWDRGRSWCVADGNQSAFKRRTRILRWNIQRSTRCSRQWSRYYFLVARLKQSLRADSKVLGVRLEQRGYHDFCCWQLRLQRKAKHNWLPSKVPRVALHWCVSKRRSKSFVFVWWTRARHVLSRRRYRVL